MMSSRHNLFLGSLFLFLLNFCTVFPKKNDKSQELKGNYTFQVPVLFGNLSLKRAFIEDSCRKYPLITAIFLGSLVTCGLYKSEIQKYIFENREKVVGATFCALLAAYYKKDFIIEKIFDDSSLGQDAEEQGHGIEKFAQSGVRIYRPGEIKTKFEDVAGLETAKEDLRDLLMFLKNPDLFKSIGAKIPKGVLLSGSPGNGKTLIARALAGEVGCPFLYISGSEFIEAIVGIGAARIRHLFSVARDLAPCIIFIDEIDAVGRKRASYGFGGDTELTQTLNQLLAEMDGFEPSDNPIILIGATNRVDVLDEALLRPGRFDRKIEICLPFVKDRFQILQVHLKKVKIAANIDVQKIAQATKGFSGAELAELVNEAAILALRENVSCVTMKHFDQARDYMLLGRETQGMDIDQSEYWQTAIHEAGHALIHVYQDNAHPLYKVTIVPRGNALGLTFGMEYKEKYHVTEQEMKCNIAVCLGGSVAEEMIFGHRGAGACSDLNTARRIATSMVMQYGMTDEFKDVSFSEFIDNQVHLPDQIATKLHQAVAKVISECRVTAENILQDHKKQLLQLAEMLMQEGTVIGSDVYKLCGIQEPNIVYSLAR